MCHCNVHYVILTVTQWFNVNNQTDVAKFIIITIIYKVKTESKKKKNCLPSRHKYKENVCGGTDIQKLDLYNVTWVSCILFVLQMHVKYLPLDTKQLTINQSCTLWHTMMANTLYSCIDPLQFGIRKKEINLFSLDIIVPIIL